MIRVSVIGAQGRMGQYVTRAVEQADDMQLVLCVDSGDDIREVSRDNTDVAVEFSTPHATLDNVLALIDQGVHVVVGTTGWSEDKLDAVRRSLDEHPEVSVFIAPNFAISTVIAQHCAVLAARYFESAEIVELHHPDKLDAPSGTAVHTAHALGQARREAGMPDMPDRTQSDGGSRGQIIDGVHVHALRIRGMNAHEEILLGNPGELLTIRADSFDRSSFMPGVLLAVRHAGQTPGLAIGLEKYLDLG